MKKFSWFRLCNTASLFVSVLCLTYLLVSVWLLKSTTKNRSTSAIHDDAKNKPKAIVNFTHITPNMPNASFRNSLAMSQQIEQMVVEVGSLYRAKMKRLIHCQMSGQCPRRVVVSRCIKLDGFCGGYGDRLFNIVNSFYSAFATDSFLIVDMKKPVPLTEFYDLTSTIYGNDSGAEELINKNTDGTTGVPSIAPFFSSEKYRQAMEELQQAIQRNFINPETLKPMPVPYELLYFVALQVIFAKPKPILQEAVDGALKKIDDIGGDASKKCRIGVHLRIAPKGGYPRGLDHPRVTKKHLETCFFEKVIEVSKSCPKTQTIPSPKPVVYIASDSDKAKQLLIENLEKAGISATSGNVKGLQLDLNFVNVTYEARRQVFLSTLIDWTVLTKMNELVITRSGFSEFASTFSSLLSYRRPSHRLPINLYDDCRFDDDFYRKTLSLENFMPPDGVHVREEFES